MLMLTPSTTTSAIFRPLWLSTMRQSIRIGGLLETRLIWLYTTVKFSSWRAS